MGLQTVSSPDERLELILHLVKDVVMNLLVLADIHPYERTSRVGLPEGFRRDNCHGRRWGGREADRVDARGVRWTERLRSGQPHLAGSEAPGRAGAYADL